MNLSHCVRLALASLGLLGLSTGLCAAKGGALADRIFRANDGAVWFYKLTPGSTSFDAGGDADGQAWFGAAVHIPLVGDVDGDNIVDRVVCWDGGGYTNWALDLSDGKGKTVNNWTSGPLGDGTSDGESSFGGPPDTNRVPLLGDVNGDSHADRVIFDGGTWFADLSTATGFGDGTPDMPSGSPTFGVAGDVPALGDFNGDGLADRVVYRDAGDGNGVFFVDFTVNGTTWGDGQADLTLNFGSFASGMRPTPLLDDFNGDNLADLVLTQPDTANGFTNWYLSYSPKWSGADSTVPFGPANGVCLVGNLGGNMVPVELSTFSAE